MGIYMILYLIYMTPLLLLLEQLHNSCNVYLSLPLNWNITEFLLIPDMACMIQQILSPSMDPFVYYLPEQTILKSYGQMALINYLVISLLRSVFSKYLSTLHSMIPLLHWLPIVNILTWL